jgi:methyl-accepting chemotaxis protein
MAPRRRVFIIDREYQWRYLSTWLIMTIAYVLIILVVMYVGLRLNQQAFQQSEARVLEQLSGMLKWNALFIILLTIFLGLITLMLSHRVAGPAYRLTKSIKRVISGDFDFTVTLRKRDYLQDVAAGMNDLIDHLRAREEKLKGLDAEADRLREMVAAEGIPPAVRESVERISLGLDSVLEKSPVPELKPLSRADQAAAETGSGAH